MISRADIVAEARRWNGTPYHDQGRLWQVGCDCLGLVFKVGEVFGLLTKDYNDYHPQPDGFTLEARCEEHLTRAAGEPQPGDVGLFWMAKRSWPQHLGIFCERDGLLAVVHAHQRFGKVTEHRVDHKIPGHGLSDVLHKLSAICPLTSPFPGPRIDSHICEHILGFTPWRFS